MGFSRQEYWSGLPFPSPGDLPNPGIKPRSPALQTDALLSEPPGKLLKYSWFKMLCQSLLLAKWLSYTNIYIIFCSLFYYQEFYQFWYFFFQEPTWLLSPFNGMRIYCLVNLYFCYYFSIFVIFSGFNFLFSLVFLDKCSANWSQSSFFSNMYIWIFFFTNDYYCCIS